MKLYPYQTEGAERLKQGNCILADEMGLGKTVTALRAAFDMKVASVTILCPLAVCGVWEHHVELLDKPDFCAVKVCSYSQLKNAPLKGSILIIDEGHYVKNRKAIRTVTVKRISRGYSTVWVLTGTPYVNHTADYWSLLNICYPKLFSSYWRYVEIWCTYEWSPFGSRKKLLPGARNPEQFAKMLQSYLLRRTKEQVGINLPKVTESVMSVKMTPPQAKYHREALKQIILQIAEKNWHIPNAAVAYTRARQVAVDPRILGAEQAGGKISVLCDLLEEASSRVVVFSEFVEALKLANKDFPGWLYHGGLNESQRDNILAAWKSDPMMRPLYMSRAAGGVGITLIEAHTCIFLDEPWTAADREQAIARVHRIGQKNPITVYSLRSEKSVEDHVIELQEGKRDALARIHRALMKGEDW
jgi:SNF2 family DNA or RNA helicase